MVNHTTEGCWSYLHKRIQKPLLYRWPILVHPTVFFRRVLPFSLFDPALIEWYWFSSPKVGLVMSPQRPLGNHPRFLYVLNNWPDDCSSILAEHPRWFSVPAVDWRHGNSLADPCTEARPSDSSIPETECSRLSVKKCRPGTPSVMSFFTHCSSLFNAVIDNAGIIMF